MTCKIPLTGGRFAAVDDKWFEELNKFRWYALKGKHTYYAVRKEPAILRGYSKRRLILMHRVIKGVNGAKHPFVDHIDHDGLNNRDENLELKTNRGNTQNRRDKSNCSSRYVGVVWNNLNKNWRAAIWDGYTRHDLGSHTLEENAARAYDTALEERGLPRVNFK